MTSDNVRYDAYERGWVSSPEQLPPRPGPRAIVDTPGRPHALESVSSMTRSPQGARSTRVTLGSKTRYVCGTALRVVVTRALREPIEHPLFLACFLGKSLR